MLYVWNLERVDQRSTQKIAFENALSSLFFDNFLVSSVGSIIGRDKGVLNQFNGKSINVVTALSVVCVYLYFDILPHKTNIFYIMNKVTFKVYPQSHFSSRTTPQVHGTLCNLTFELAHFLSEWLTDDQWHILILPVNWVPKVCKVCYQFVLYFGFISLGMKSSWNIFRQFDGEWVSILAHCEGAFVPFEHVLNGVEVFVTKVPPSVFGTSLKPFAVLKT